MRTFSVINSYRRQKQEKEKKTENKDVARKDGEAKEAKE